MAFAVKRDPGAPPAALFNGPDFSTGILRGLSPGESIEIDDLVEQETADAVLSQTWLKCRYRQGTLPAIEGWIERIFVDFGVVQQPDFPEITLENGRLGIFVAECAEAERLTREQAEINAGPDAPNVILADFLIALALAETDLKALDTQLPGTDAVGPFQISSEEWQSFLDSGEAGDYEPISRFEMIAQIDGATWLTQRAWRDMVDQARVEREAAGGAADDHYVPSFLNLYHARLLGPKVAYAINAANADEDTKNDDLEGVIAKVLDSDELAELKKHREKLFSATPPATVNGFFIRSADTLRGELTRAFTLIKEHYPPFAKLPSTGEAPWMPVAEAERAQWMPADGGTLSETNQDGQARIVEKYFRSTNYNPTQVEPWCGAFVAWCLANCGDESAAASVFPGAARAANWKTWGDVDVRLGSLKQLGANQLKGAVVVLHPGKGTGSSGHVCFAVSRDGDSIQCLGGNQSDTVRVSTYNINRIAAVRMLQPPETKAVADGEINQAAIDLVKQFEGLRLDSYQDSVKVWTIGYGTTSRAGIGVTVGPGMTITEPQAEEFLARGLRKFAQEIKPAITPVPTPNQFGAMVSLAYNIGSGGFRGSTVLRKFNEGDIQAAADAFKMWVKAGGKELPGLVNRRAAERELFLTA
jgi:uncharacterized protein (TIGR02594 family)